MAIRIGVETHSGGIMKEGSRRFQYQGASLLVRSFRYVVSGPGETRPMGRYAYDASPPNASISLKPQYTTRAVPLCGTSEYAVEDFLRRKRSLLIGSFLYIVLRPGDARGTAGYNRKGDDAPRRFPQTASSYSLDGNLTRCFDVTERFCEVRTRNHAEC